MAHTGDKVPHDAWDERFEHPARTWASASHRSFTLQATGVAMANATYMLTGSPGSRQLNRVCAPRSGGSAAERPYKTTSVSSNIEKLVVTLTSGLLDSISQT